MYGRVFMNSGLNEFVEEALHYNELSDREHHVTIGNSAIINMHMFSGVYPNHALHHRP